MYTCADYAQPFLKGRANDEERKDEQNDAVRPCRITGVPRGTECHRQAPRDEHREKTLMYVAELGCHSSQMRANLS